MANLVKLSCSANSSRYGCNAQKLFARKDTIYFPEEKTPQSVRFRGLHAQRGIRTVRNAALHVNCARRCPAMAINIESEEREDGTRRTKRYDIDLTSVSSRLLRSVSDPMRLWKRIFLNTTARKKAACSMTKPILLAIGDKYNRNRQTQSR